MDLLAKILFHCFTEEAEYIAAKRQSAIKYLGEKWVLHPEYRGGKNNGR